MKHISDFLDGIKRIIFITDIDFDGMSCNVIAREFFKDKDGYDVTYIISSNKYKRGINIDIMEKIANFLPNQDDYSDTLIITADMGSSDIKELKEINHIYKNIKIIITDHHLIPDEAELANETVAVINPHHSKSTLNKNYSGANVLYHFLSSLPHSKENILGYVLMANIVDQMSMADEENRRLYLEYIEELRNYPIVQYILKLTKRSRCHDQFISRQLAPIINSCNRLSKSRWGVYALMGHPDFIERAWILNVKRKETSKEMYEFVKRQLRANLNLLPYIMIVVVVGEETRPMCGVLAGRIAQEKKVPTIVLHRDKNGKLSGSARTYANFNFKDHLNYKGIVTKGHKGAFGIDVSDSKAFVNMLEGYIAEAKEKSFVYKEDIVTLPCDKDNIYEVAKTIEVGRPYGNSNRYPMVKYKGVIEKIMFRNKVITKFRIDNITGLHFGNLRIEEGEATYLGELSIDKDIELVVGDKV